MLAKEIGRRGRYIKEVAYGIEFTIPLVQFFQREFVLIQASIIKIGSLPYDEIDEARDEGQAEAEARWDDAAFSAVWGVGDNALSPPAPFGFSGRPALAFDEHGLPELAEADAVGFNWATFEARIDEKAKEAQMRLLEEGLVPAPPPASSAPASLAPASLAPAPSAPALCPTYGERCAHRADCALNGSHLLPAKKARLGLFSPHPLSPALPTPPVANREPLVQARAIPASPPVVPVAVEGGVFDMELEPAPSQASLASARSAALATQGSAAPGSPPPSQASAVANSPYDDMPPRQPWPVLELARAGWLDTHYNSGGAFYVRSHDEGRIIDEFKRIWFALGSKLSILSTLPDQIRMQILEWYAKARDSQWDDVNLRDLSRLRSAVAAYVTNYEYHAKKPQFEVEPIPMNLVPLGWDRYPEYSWDRGLNPPPPALPAPPAPPINAPAPRDVRRDIREWEEWSNDPKNWLPGEAELRKRARLMPGDRYPDRE
eukprot:tig00021137_g18993.t1